MRYMSFFKSALFFFMWKVVVVCDSLKEYFRLQLVAADMLRFIESNTAFAPLVIHGFSVGGYMWGELCFIASSNKPRYVDPLKFLL